MEEQPTNPNKIRFAALGVVLVVLIGVFTLIKTSGPSQPDVLDPTGMYSPITKTTDNLTINYQADSNPEQQVVKQPFRVFNIDALPLPGAVKSTLLDTISDALLRNASPTYPPTSVQIARDSIDCDTVYDCRFSFYIDSPERYYDFRIFYDSGGKQQYHITEQPLPEIKR